MTRAQLNAALKTLRADRDRCAAAQDAAGIWDTDAARTVRAAFEAREDALCAQLPTVAAPRTALDARWS